MKKTLSWIILFAIAMGLLETSVVIYLRELYYPNGFEFPLRIIPLHVARVEILRELATVIMLVAVGILSGTGRLQRFAYFVLAFAVWDLFYYIFLYLLIQWPQSLFTWDILFLIPLPWVGPVWAPCLLCLIMIYGSIYVITRTQIPGRLSISRFQWFLMVGGACTCILSFMWDYLQYTRERNGYWTLLSKEELFLDFANYRPEQFNYTLFFAGFVGMCASILISILKNKSNENQ